MVWTFLPLIPGEFEAMIKNCMLALHAIQMDVCLPDTAASKNDNFSLKLYRLLSKISFAVVTIFQLYELLIVIILTRNNGDLNMYFYNAVSIFAAIINQIVFVELLFSVW